MIQKALGFTTFFIYIYNYGLMWLCMFRGQNAVKRGQNVVTDAVTKKCPH